MNILNVLKCKYDFAITYVRVIGLFLSRHGFAIWKHLRKQSNGKDADSIGSIYVVGIILGDSFRVGKA